MIIIPAIDLKEGKCVRLMQGRFNEETVYSNDPVAVAREWKEEGASLIHIVDLDGARDGIPVHLPVIETIISETGLDIELGGGIRDIETVEKYIDIGVKRIVLGTAIIKNPDFVKKAAARCPVYAGIDSRNGIVAVRGWIEESGIEASSLIKSANELGVSGIIYTDIMKDGTLEGIDTDHISNMVGQTSLPFVVSGGISSLEDLTMIKRLDNPQIEGIIIGKALYCEAFNLKDAITLLGQDYS